ncbi:MAG: zinc-binding dehydrogenase [Acidimicrobiales bacterium]|nr:zinc-binding dehydrogenase [Acidimicrobiales bacterium]MDP6895234.1 zinc-binding dehydrogenase [Acidimicrobiales bacterium]HJM38121.1 zinc-binding dehydrogenase [Acidimicrobiales bacterium]|tara:strand:- start:1199 stop:2419 length:1221 start_codon:yes stop_codon:yes gene_type:complete
MKALRFKRNIPRYAAAKIAGNIMPGSGASFGPIDLIQEESSKTPGKDWVRVRPRLSGICGSDLATVDGKSARYFEPLVSFPFTPGHEVVGDLDDDSRVVLEPVLSCASRNISPPCFPCSEGKIGNCENVTLGEISSGIQTGSCHDTGGGWATEFYAHPSQLHSVPDDFSDEAAVMVEPTACGVHAALAAELPDEGVVAILGSGTLGQVTISALRHFTNPKTIISTARYPEQKRLAAQLGSDIVVNPEEVHRAVRRACGTKAITNVSEKAPDGRVDRLTGGADVVIDCVGSSKSISDALSITKPNGKVVLVGMPATVELELTPLWHRELQLIGAYTYGTERLPDGKTTSTFDLAFELVKTAKLEELVSACYSLDDYQEALKHAANAGVRGAFKIVFDLRDERERYIK